MTISNVATLHQLWERYHALVDILLPYEASFKEVLNVYRREIENIQLLTEKVGPELVAVWKRACDIEEVLERNLDEMCPGSVFEFMVSIGKFSEVPTEDEYLYVDMGEVVPNDDNDVILPITSRIS